MVDGVSGAELLAVLLDQHPSADRSRLAEWTPEPESVVDRAS